MIKRKNESKILTKDISCKCKFDERKCNSEQWWNKYKCRSECKKHHICEKDYIWKPASYSCKNGQYLANIMDDSVIRCDEIIDAEDKSYKKETNFNKKKLACKTQNFYILLAILLIKIALLIAASIYCYLIKYQAKEKHLLPFHTNNELTVKVKSKK